MTGQCPCTTPKPREKPFRLYHIRPCLNIHPLSTCISLGKALSGCRAWEGKKNRREREGEEEGEEGGRHGDGQMADVRERGNEGARPPWFQGDGLSLEKRKDGGYLLSRWTQYHRRGRA